MTPLPKDETKRQRIITAAIEVFAEEGVSKGKIAAIAAKAGIGKGTIYEYFGSKEEIFKAVFHDFFRQMMHGYSELIDAPIKPEQKLKQMLDYTFDLVDQMVHEKQQKEWVIFLEILLQGFRDELLGLQKYSFSKILRELYDVFKPLVDEGIQAGVFRKLDPRAVTFILFAALDGISIHYFMNQDRFETQSLKNTVRTIFLNGILMTGTEGM
jgi:AcrR family transcriptional regulator